MATTDRHQAGVRLAVTTIRKVDQMVGRFDCLASGNPMTRAKWIHNAMGAYLRGTLDVALAGLLRDAKACRRATRDASRVVTIEDPDGRIERVREIVHKSPITMNLIVLAAVIKTETACPAPAPVEVDAAGGYTINDNLWGK